MAQSAASENQEIEDVIGDLEVPDDVLDLLIFSEMDTLVRLKPSHRLRF